jgi:hypothetical protein
VLEPMSRTPRRMGPNLPADRLVSGRVRTGTDAA